MAPASTSAVIGMWPAASRIRTGGGFSYAFTPDWSPDGTRIVFFLFLDSTGRVDIYTARSDGSHVAPVTATPDFEDFADWGTPPASV